MGTKLKLGDKEFVLAPMNFNRVEKALAAFDAVKLCKTFREALPLQAEIVFLGVQQVWPEVTMDFVKDNLTKDNYDECLLKVFEVSGIVIKAPATGETSPVTSPSAGEISTPSS
jgi:hypothetical protein